MKWRKRILKDITKYGKGLLKNIAGIVYPDRCPLCGKVMYTGSGISTCMECTGKAEYVKAPFCMKCGKPVRQDTELCLDCQGKETSFECGRAVFVYNRCMQQSVAQFKYGGRTGYAGFYASKAAELYGSWIESISPDAFIPVPIHGKRRLKRGFNQSGIIAGLLGELMGIQVIHNMVVRTKDTVPQKNLSDKERKLNLSGAFEVVKESRELYQNIKCVIIIDDIYTTGSTIEECSFVLKRANIKEVYFLCTCIGKGY